MQPTSRLTAARATRLRSPVRRWILGAAGLAALTTLIAVAQPPPQSPPINPDKPEVNHLSDKNDQLQQHDDQAKKQNLKEERNKQISDDTSKLLELATQLKAEVDKTSKDTLSINVIRKAESIEKLAKGVKEKMKLTTGAS